MASDLEALISRIRDHDEAALAEYVDLHRSQLLAFIDRRMREALRKKVDPVDVLQEVSVSCLSALKTIDLNNRDPFRWLCQQAERRIIDEHRRHFGAKKRSAHREVLLNSPRDGWSEKGLEDFLIASFTTPSHAFSKGQKELHLGTAMEQLSEDAQVALRLRYLDGLPSKEIATRLGKSDASVRILLSRSLKKLQKILSENEEFQTWILQNKPHDE
ncbi:ECF RNA polymerase sigma factor SigK [Thalassoglobus neptunius]|uniref:ECF RNA polymerase sigma factor SigK n=1 Tax=Thalassoglobus neptunius TaxID=1938619 RepID=A0A5C5X460_9PLAN|nr:sigma-70 family RNA polymerase sigma factor [Thalassoglobus neptunius]TWT57013.1 ECF RNA polymerase sigma factor SigK [Thalassoglobus neptunius]